MRDRSGALTTEDEPAGPAGTAGANACVLNELVALSATDVLLLAEDALDRVGPNQEGSLAVRSRDGGATWASLVLPPVPGPTQRALRGLQMLPDGALIVRPQMAAGWPRLDAGASAWCAVPGPALTAPYEAADSARVVGDRLWLTGGHEHACAGAGNAAGGAEHPAPRP